MDKGIVLTSTDDLGGLLGTMRGHGLPLIKVATGWPVWNDSMRQQVCAMPSVVVRTVSGDGCQGDPLLTPQQVLAELGPWLDIRHDLLVELGNEPNMADPSDDAAWAFRWTFLESADLLLSKYPNARIVSPGLFETRQPEWWAICRDAFEHYIVGWHAYGWYGNPTGDTGQLRRALEQLGHYYPYSPWLGTELGVNDPHTPPEQKAAIYHDACETLPEQVIGVAFYHVCDQPIPADVDPQAHADQVAYALPVDVLQYI